MDQILNYVEMGSANISAVYLIPVLLAVFGAVAVFSFGFQKSDRPKFRKLMETGSKELKRKKRIIPESNVPSLTAVNSKENKLAKRVETAGQKHTKKESTPRKMDTAAAVQKVSAINTSKNIKDNVVSVHAPPFTSGHNQKKQKRSVKGDNTKADSDGEWQTVITKKNKKQIDPLLQAVAEAAAKAHKSPLSAVARKTIKKEEKCQSQQNTVKQPRQELPIALENRNISVPSSPKSEIAAVSIVESPKTSPVPFDQLIDSDWVETKPKKNKKRAVRE